ncbi:transcriptional regulator [Xanthomonas arboricola pv. pruni str. MAFF 311562]|uniref:Transcriptional regulator n=1 Tax=Xanthomonas arboricola pv. pruni str. MAFF 311562 TaxID=1414836 RepID=W4S8S9_9XANT|nr:transcriptional regulator [Xanthomonas arboricola pv. pruni str. MAFF 311562]GAE61077.1 hypothetical protein XPN_2983 [Xanthomonas arboricola pv. pruni MAFF 301427]
MPTTATVMVPARGKRGLVRDRVHAGGHAADDGQPGAGQAGGECAGVVAAAGGGGAAADHGHARVPERVRVAVHEQGQRRIDDVAQQGGVVGIVQADQVMAGLLAPLQGGVQGACIGGLQPGHLQLVAAGGKPGLGPGRY